MRPREPKPKSRRPMTLPKLDPSWRVVRFNRRRLRILLVVGLVAIPIGFWLLTHAINPDYMWAWGWVLICGPGASLMAGLLLSLEERYFRYDTHAFTIKAVDQRGADILKRWRTEGKHPWHPDNESTYPEPEFTHLEYSSAFAEIHQVREDGSRKRLWIRAKWAEPSDWEAFVQHLHRIGAVRPPAQKGLDDAR